MIYIFMTITCNGDDGFQNMFVYQPTFNTLELIKDKPNIKYFGSKIGI